MVSAKINIFGHTAELDDDIGEWKCEDADVERYLREVRDLFALESNYFPDRRAAFFEFTVAYTGAQIIELPESFSRERQQNEFF